MVAEQSNLKAFKNVNLNFNHIQSRHHVLQSMKRSALSNIGCAPRSIEFHKRLARIVDFLLNPCAFLFHF